MSRGTSHHTVRIEDELWAAAQTKAAEEGGNLSAIIRDALRRYIEEAAAPRMHAGVLRLHSKESGDYSDRSGQRWTGDHCTHCRDEWPCATIEALMD